MRCTHDGDAARMWEADCMELLRGIPTDSIDAVITDPPYFKVIDEPWDKQWDDPAAFLAWLGGVAAEWQRVLKPNGSLYCFASPQLAAHVEVQAITPVGFAVLNRPVWHKTNAAIWKANRDGLSQYHSGDNERIIFAQPLKEHAGAKHAKAAYMNAGHALAAQVFAPIREYLAAERDRAGFTDRQIDEALGCNGMAGHWFGRSQWSMPSRDRYAQLRDLFNTRGDHDYLRRDYDDLRRDYDDLRRPFNLGPESGQRPRGEVWRFAPAPRTPGRHPCEKPQPLLAHLIHTSTRPGDTVLDTFAGGGSTAIACIDSGRRFIGADLSPHWADTAALNIRDALNHRQDALFEDHG